MPADHKSEPRPTVLLLTHCRTASHVLERMLSKQPNMHYGSHWFFLSRMQRRALLQAGPVAEIDLDLPKEYMKASSDSFSQFLEFLEDAGKEETIPFAHTQPHAMLTPDLLSDHVYGPSAATGDGPAGQWMAECPPSWQGESSEKHTNPTVLPDWVLLRPGTVPILNFCHPILLCERVFRGFTATTQYDITQTFRMVSVGATLRWQRLMYEWYLEHGVPVGIQPILLDADDYLGPEKESLMKNLCRQASCLDLNSIIYSWPKTTPEALADIDPEMQKVHQTILASDGIMASHSSQGLDIETEAAKWVKKHGQAESDRLRELVAETMPDYQYLMAHRLRPDDSS